MSWLRDTCLMCGRYVSAQERSVIDRQFATSVLGAPTSRATSLGSAALTQSLGPDYNVAPSKKVYAVMNRHDERQLRVVTWGLIPSWARDPAIGNRLINARLETAAEKPSFRRAFAKRRTVLPADGYYEWYSPADGPKLKNGKPRKQPFYIHPRDGELMAMAGLYEIWRDESITDEDAPGAFRWTCAVLTTTATDDLGRIHDRMPLLVAADRLEEWLNPALETPPADILVPAAPGLLDAYAVSTDVNKVANNDSHLIAPLDPADVPHDVANETD